MFKKSVEYGEYKGIQYSNGKVRFQGFALNVYAYAVDGILIDTGSQSLAQQMQPFLENADVDKVILTHNHEDHTGGARFMQKKGKPIYIHPDSVKAVQSKPDLPVISKAFLGQA